MRAVGNCFPCGFSDSRRPAALAGKKVWWHSSAHILGECCERHYGCHLAIGPPTDEGFFYEMGMTDDR